jgi:hypothetical protein
MLGIDYNVYKNCIDVQLINDVLRAIHFDIIENGLSPRDIEYWNNDSCWFPKLRFSKEIIALRDCIPKYLRTGIQCEPQIQVDFPSDYEGDIWPHTDTPPDWATQGRKYRRIIGVPLTEFDEDNGGVRIWCGGDGVECPKLFPGDVLIMYPHTKHSKGVNKTGLPRYAVYFRYLQHELS